MLTIDSNLDGIIRQTEALIQNIQVAMEQAFAPALWITEARDLAEKTLLTLCTLKHARFVPAYVATVTAAVLQGGGLSLTMRAPMGSLTLAQLQAARAAIDPSDLGANLFVQNVQAFEDLLVDWVQTEKRKDERDYGKTDEEVAHLISYILLSPNLGPKGMKARQGLTPHIAAYLAKRTGGVDDATSDQWLLAVLAAWRWLVSSKYPEKVQAILAGMKGRLI